MGNGQECGMSSYINNISSGTFQQDHRQQRLLATPHYFTRGQPHANGPPSTRLIIKER